MKRAILPVLTGLWGGATMLAMSGTMPTDPGLITAAGAGASLAGVAAAPLFRKPHPIWTFAAAVLATGLGAALTGAWIGYPGEVWLGLIVAPLVLCAAITGDPAVLLVWLLGAAALRLTARHLSPTIP